MATTKKKTTKPEHDFSKLTAGQMMFIQNKVIELGSVETTDRYYHRGDTVGEFAKMFARAYFKGGR